MITDPISPAWGCPACAGLESHAYVRTHIVIKNDTLTRLDIRWQLSETLAQALFIDYDIDRDGNLDKEERQALNKAFADGLRSVNYHTTLVANERKLTPLVFDNPRVEWQPTLTRFMFSIQLQEPIGDGLRMSLTTYDPKLHLQFYHVQDSVTWNTPACCRLSHNSHLFPKVLEMSILPLASATASASPMAGTEEDVHRPPPGASPPKGILGIFSKLLLSLHTQLKNYLADIKTGGSTVSVLLLIGFAFVYGLVHAMGPGHGKSLVTSYFLSRHHHIRKALGMALAIGAVHVFSAFGLTVTVLILLNLMFAPAIQQATMILTRLSGLMIILIAIYLTALKIRATRHSGPHRPSSSLKQFPFEIPAEPSCSCIACRPTSPGTDAMLVISAGVIPCPGTVTVFLFAISMQLYLVGVLAAAAMSLGMGLVIFAVSTVGITSRNRLANRYNKLTRLLEFSSLGIIFILGLLLLLVRLE
jgi:ABC-type nickel/cobalt efflux system permease component RcnA